jgi:hypothetical protein
LIVESFSSSSFIRIEEEVEEVGDNKASKKLRAGNVRGEETRKRNSNNAIEVTSDPQSRFENFFEVTNTP